MSLGLRIKELRKKKKLTLKQLADAIGKSEGLISHYETGKHKPTLEGLEEIAKALGVSVAELMPDYSEAKDLPVEPPKSDYDLIETLYEENKAYARRIDELQEEIKQSLKADNANLQRIIDLQDEVARLKKIINE